VSEPTVLIRLQGVGKAYPLLHTGGRKLAHFWSLLRSRPSGEQFHALQGVDLEIRQGESLGLVGVNGAGKSTLLKLMAGVVKPSTGTLTSHARVGALLELGAGFHPEYTGRENVFLACALMGLSRAQTLERLDDILAFADIGEHVEQPIKHYSSGMVVRLGFAVATCVTPDVLITDEVLAVGDESFQRKCIAWMERYLSHGGTLLLCSHSMYHIQKLCRHAAWIHDGQLKRLGPALDVTREYIAWHERKSAGDAVGALPEGQSAAVVADTSIYHVTQLHLNGTPSSTAVELPMDAQLHVTGEVYSPDDRPPMVASSIVRPDGSPVFGVYSDISGYRAHRIAPKRFAFGLNYPRLPLLPGSYVVRAHAMDPEGMRLFDQVEARLEVVGGSRYEGVCLLEHEWFHPQ